MNFDPPTRGEMYPLLDAGHVTYVDHMGDEADIVDAARVSYKRQGQSSDYDLLRYLMRNRHTSPFEMCELKVIVKCPIFVARQWVRHRTASMNEVSARYTELSEEVYVPKREDINVQSTNNKQGRDFTTVKMQDEFIVAGWQAFDHYYHLLEHDVSRELARAVTPVGTYTEFVWKIDLHNLLHFLHLRCDSHAQYEIRVYANALLEIANRLWPITIKAWQDYVHSAMTLSYHEQVLIALSQKDDTDVSAWHRYKNTHLSKREAKEFLTKCEILDIPGFTKGENDE